MLEALMVLREAVRLALAHSEARMSFTVERSQEYGGGLYGIFSCKVVADGNDHFTVESSRLAHAERPDGRLDVNFDAVRHWTFSLNVTDVPHRAAA